MDILHHIQTPDMQYRPMNYWGWLENITPEETDVQVRQMHAAGLGGYVMHARGGLTIPYMGVQWMDSVRAMIKAGEELGMANIVDDEHGWPSGFGAGTVNGRGPDYWVKWLRCESLPGNEIVFRDTTLSVCQLREGTAQRLSMGEAAQTAETLHHIFYEFDRFYVDNMDPDVVEAFEAYSYEGYLDKLGDDFTKLWGIFSDEPQLARYATPWSQTIPALFRERFGYDILDHLSALFFEYHGCEAVRYDFWALCSDLFTTSYAKRLCSWCEDHGISFTGHTTLEESFYYQLQCSGNTMPFYEYMTVPGIDFLSRIRVDEMLCKQVTSVAEQLGKRRVLSEMYGCAGWNVSFEELKWIADIHYVLGINLMLQHLGLYSLRGSRKREYPASLFYQQPWWEDFKPFNDYYARLSQLLGESRPLTRTLVLHPIKSAWLAYNGHNSTACNALEARFKTLTRALLALGVDFHYGDETLLARHGSVRDGMLHVGLCAYDTVIVPPCFTLDTSTVDLFRNFASHNTGRLLYIGEFPTHVNGRICEELGSLQAAAVAVSEGQGALEAALAPLVRREIRVRHLDGTPNQSVYCLTRELDGQMFHYIVNTDKDNRCDICIHADGPLSQLDLQQCVLKPMDTERVQLEGAQSMLLVHEAVPQSAPAPMKTIQVQVLDGPWKVGGDTRNSLTLDRCAWSEAGGRWQAEVPLVELQQTLMHRALNGEVAMKFSFCAETVPQAPLYLVLENPELTTIELNGQSVRQADCGWWVDKSMRKVDISGRVVVGDNTLILTRRFACSEHTYHIKNDPAVHEAESNRVTVETELESIYLLGRFGVRAGFIEDAGKQALWADGPFTLTEPPCEVVLGDVTRQGFAFFAGALRLEHSFVLDAVGESERIVVRLRHPDAVVCEVLVNGNSAGKLMWAPWCVDVTQLCHEGENTMVLRLVGSCRNLLGPHHHREGEILGVGPHSFLKNENWTERYSLVRFGVDAPVTVEKMSYADPSALDDASGIGKIP